MTQTRLQSTPYPPLSPGTLWTAIVNQTRVAIQEGALHRIETEQVRIKDGGVDFLVRSVSSPRRKRREEEGVAKTQHEGRRSIRFCLRNPH